MDYDALEGKQLEKCISLMIDLINRKGAYDSELVFIAKKWYNRRYEKRVSSNKLRK